MEKRLLLPWTCSFAGGAQQGVSTRQGRNRGVWRRAGKRGRGPRRRVAPAGASSGDERRAPATNDEGERTREEEASSAVGGRARGRQILL
jgi:hypothetical protein